MLRLQSSVDSRKELRQLLQSLFTIAELQRFVKDRYGNGFRISIDWKRSQTEVADEVADALDRHGHLNENLFEAFTIERPNRVVDIVAAKTILLHEGPDDPETPTSPVATLVNALVPLLSLRRTLDPDSDEFVALSARINPVVDEIQQRFHPKRDSVVAGAKLVRVIGSGNFGTIWEGNDIQTNNRVAVKVFRMERITEGQMLVRFRRGVRAMRILSEEKRLSKRSDERGAVACFHVADSTGLAFSMHYLSGGNLEKIESFGWDPKKKIQAILAVCAAVRYAHENGIIHRDVKPANVLLDEHKKPVLTDFDIADVKWATGISTLEGGLGTPIFAAPEQLQEGDRADERSDIYSLGRLLYFLLLERSPGFQIEKDPSLTNLSGYPPALVEIVRKAIQYDPARRFAHVTDMISALESMEEGWAGIIARATRAIRWSRQNSVALLSMILVVSGALGVAYLATTEARVQAKLAQARRDQNKQLEELAARIALVAGRADKIRYESDSVRRQISEIQASLPTLSGKPQARALSLLETLQQRSEELERQESNIANKILNLQRELRGMQRTSAAQRCQTSPACVTEGLCGESSGECVATAIGCAISEKCKKEGYCGVSGNVCVLNYSGCRSSENCRNNGICGYDPRKAECFVTAGGCEASQRCGSEGFCGLSKEGCAVTAKGCLSSERCMMEGICGYSAGICVATISGCRSSVRGTNSHCTLRHGRCHCY